jgi:ribosomal-protein-alanine N-acetyltransferase
VVTTELLPIIETERLQLRAFELSDADDIVANMTPSVTRWLASWPSPLTRDEAVARIERSRAAMRDGVHAFYALARRADARVIGSVGAGLVAENPRRMEISYHLAEDCHGKGFMREATQVVIPMLWRIRPAEVMEAGAQLGNEASFKVMRSIGLTPVDERLVYSSVRDRHEPTLFYESRRPA